MWNPFWPPVCPGYSFLTEFCAGNPFLLPYTLAASQFKQWHSAVNFGRALSGIEIVICLQLQAPLTISVEFILNEVEINDLLDSILTTRDFGEEGELIFSITLLLWKKIPLDCKVRVRLELVQ